MRVPRLFLEPGQFCADCARLDAAQARYLKQVLRLRTGAACIVLDGQGRSWQAVLDGNELHLAAELPRTDSELPVVVRLACAVPRGERWDWLLQKATELGANAIYPIVTERSVVQPRSEKRERWQAIVREAAEQAERAILPVVHPPRSFEALLAAPPPGKRLICTARGHRPPLTDYLPAEALTIAFGPEGGFSTAEVKRALAAGFAEANLGRRILRAETAPMAALSWLAAWYEGQPQQDT